MKIERRAFPLLEFRTEGDESPKIRGYAAVFGKLSENLGGFREKIAPGAFDKTLKSADVRALWNHNPDYVLGRNKSGTLTMQEDERGLAIEIDPPDTSWARDLITSMKRGDINQMSFGFRTVSDNWEVRGKENVRTLEEVDLFDVSPVTYPAYPQTTIKARSLIQEAGLDFDHLTQIMVRARSGLPFSKEDRSFLEQGIASLKDLIPAEASQGTSLAQSEDAPAQVRSVAMLRKRLELVSKL
ncbi:phage prohead protease, HK97 family [Marininema mesophilum]|uniref:Phage prohead protease, HK97 family n=1 Tax=Marininema mesophilum TaxID=1048340 RepID=A0A1H3BU75_9BACL|nr:HK97 family phage prohead protease [Marininema mesophilum]SDX45265.1 phage prohead protease, HK97 family [Marininema mesophilum]